jgi:hypothetical protein
MGMNENNISIRSALKTIEGIQVDWQRNKMISRATDDYTILSINRIAWMETHNSVSKEDLVKCLSVLVNFRELETAGSEVGSRCSLEKLLIESVLDMLGEVDVVSLHKAFHTVYHAVDLLVSALLS